ncbi:Uncharacterized conserved protein [Janthinobacterium sp. Marseille]|nr:hypothetical protein [Janthinobacterium sp. Marseille]ABR91435.1 Uncharacterized conserved protein [Janthinobacterium sp. Marseille]
MAIENQGATSEVEEQVTEQPQSMDDTIRDTLRELEARGTVPEVPDEVIPDAPDDTAQRTRDEKGKFAAKAADATTGQASAPVDQAVTAEPVSQAPNTWRKEAAAVWPTLPPEARAEIEKREADVHRGIEQYKVAAQFAQTVEKAISPYMQTIQQLGITPDVAIGELMAADHKLRYGQPAEKHAYFAQLAQTYGIDLGAVTQHQQEQPRVDPAVMALQQTVQSLVSKIQTQESSVQQQAQESLNSEIQSFAADPNHSHFETVKPHMIALLQAGQAKDLSDAYEQAVYANPTTRASMLQQQVNARLEESTKKAQAAKTAASVNTRTRPSMAVSEPIGSMDDTIRATLRRLQGS